MRFLVSGFIGRLLLLRCASQAFHDVKSSCKWIKSTTCWKVNKLNVMIGDLLLYKRNKRLRDVLIVDYFLVILLFYSLHIEYPIISTCLVLYQITLQIHYESDLTKFCDLLANRIGSGQRTSLYRYNHTFISSHLILTVRKRFQPRIRLWSPDTRLPLFLI